MQIDLPIVKKIALAAAYKKAGVKKVFKALDNQCLFVGGCVRDALLKQGSCDIDLATPVLPRDVMAALRDAGIKAIATGLDHGTVTAAINGANIEITTLRKDVSTDGRRAVVAFSTDWVEDSQRRDFTFNALLMDLKGNIYDPTGRGVGDLTARKVVFIGDARARVREDYLRILRYFRFCARYDMALDSDVLTIFNEEISGLAQVSKERITAEIFKILQSTAPQAAIHALGAYPMFSWFGASADHLDDFCTEQVRRNAYDELGRLFLICCGGSLSVKDDLRLSNRDVSTLGEMSRFVNEYPRRTIDYLLYHYNHRIVKQGALYLFALNSISDVSLAFILSEIKAWRDPAFPINGGLLIDEGYEAGARLGKALRHVEAWWIEENFIPKREQCIHEAIKWLGKN
jgi:poly(A) polymerase